MRRHALSLFAVCAAMLAAAQPALAQQTLNFSLGYFTVRGEDARQSSDCRRSTGANCDVLFQNRDFLDFNISDFNTVAIGGEWLVPLGQYLEAGAGIAFSRRTVPTVYRDYVDRDGSEIAQDLRLRIIPVAFTVRVLPLGQGSPVQPYFGGGLGVFRWRYSESGEFIDFGLAGQPVFRDTFVAEGNETGPIALAGLRFAGDSLSAGGEIRYQSAKGALSEDFAGREIDLGGWTYLFTVGIRFGR